MGIFNKIFGSFQDKELKEISAIADEVIQKQQEYEKLTDSELSDMTDKFKKQLRDSENIEKQLDSILVDALAVCREASWRVLKMRQYKVQIIGGIVLHRGMIAEMCTGEGKTLMETLPAYLNALTGLGVHIVTVNSYLAKRDYEEMGQIFKFLGLSVGYIQNEMQPAERQAAYNCDITYATNSEIGFDYLKDNMMLQKESKMQRKFNCCIVDEIDSVLIDDARTPLIIAMNSDDDVSEYIRANEFAKTLKRQKVTELDSTKYLDEQVDGDYVYEEKSRVVQLTDKGFDKAERWFRCGNLADTSNIALLCRINQAIKANGCMERDKDYIVLNDEVQIIDQGTGRILNGRRYSEGLHQAIEAKEGVKINKETRTHAQITYQNLFKMYRKLCGMTGTAKTSEEEFKELYGLDIITVPTNKPVIRIDHPDNVYVTEQAKIKAIVQQVVTCRQKGQPVLIGTTSVQKSENLQKILNTYKIPHKVLNAKYHEQEAQIIAQAGRYGAVTIATNMAGRGTDIKLGGTSTSEDTTKEKERVKAAGGLYIIGTERHENRRIDNQLRGRAGRQGDPGESKFFLQLEDDLIRLFGGEQMKKLTAQMGLDNDENIQNKFISTMIEKGQKTVESQRYSQRKRMYELGDTLNRQREIMYEQRDKVLYSDDVKQTILEMVDTTLEYQKKTYLNQEDNSKWDIQGFKDYYLGWLCDNNDFRTIQEEEREEVEHEGHQVQSDELIAIIRDRAVDKLNKKYYNRDKEKIDDRLRRQVLTIIDMNWKQHLENMEILKKGIELQRYAQKDPVQEYRTQGFEMFNELMQDIQKTACRYAIIQI